MAVGVERLVTVGAECLVAVAVERLVAMGVECLVAVAVEPFVDSSLCSHCFLASLIGTVWVYKIYSLNSVSFGPISLEICVLDTSIIVALDFSSNLLHCILNYSLTFQFESVTAALQSTLLHLFRI